MKRIISIFLGALIFLSNTFVYCEEPESVKIYVSVNGTEDGNGSEESPFNSIAKAKDAVRKSPDRKNKTIEVILREGTYILDQGLDFDDRDSGSEEHNVIYRAYDNEKVIISGAKEITSEKLTAKLPEDIKARLKPDVADKVFMIDLKEAGIETVDDELQDCYTADKHPTAWEKGRNALYYEGSGKLTFARFPNEGSFVQTGEIINPGSLNEGTIPIFEYEEDVISTWKNTGDIWMWGKWSSEWNPTRNRIAEIDTEKKTITCVLPPHQNVVKTAKQMYYYNVLEEIDVPGEYCIDRENLKVYIYPPEKTVVEGSYYFTGLDSHIFRLEEASHIQFKNLILQGTRRTGFYALNSKYIILDGCEVRYITNSAVEFRGGDHNTIKNCEIHDVEYEGIYMDAGDVDYLTDGHGLITNNHIYRFGGAEINYTGGVEFEGVGITVSHNLIHDAVSMAMTFEPSVNCIIEYNEIYDAARYLNDVALIYDYKDLATRDVIVRYNLLYNSHDRKRLDHTGTYGLYWDGSGHGKICYGNIFYNLNRGVMLNCGGFTHIENNIFVDVDQPIRTTSTTSKNEAWGLWFEKTNNNPQRFAKGVWKMKYPVIAEDYYAGEEGTGEKNLYRDNYIGDNLMYKCGSSDIKKADRNYIRPDIIIEEDIFEDSKALNFDIVEGKCPENFEDIIDVDKIGLLY